MDNMEEKIVMLTLLGFECRRTTDIDWSKFDDMDYLKTVQSSNQWSYQGELIAVADDKEIATNDAYAWYFEL